MIEDNASRRVRLLGGLAIAAGAAGVLAFHLMGGWHRAAAFNDTRLLLVGLNAAGAGLGLLLWLPPVTRWFSEPQAGRRRLWLSAYGSLVVLYGIFFLAAPWTPLPIGILVGISALVAVLAVAVILTERHRARLLLFSGAGLGILLAVFMSAHARYYVRIPWSHMASIEFVKSFGLSVIDTVDDLMAAGQTALDFHALPEHGLIDEVRLRTEPGSLEAMVSNLPKSAKEKYYRAYLLYPDGRWRKIRYRLRGRSIWHWFPEKPSLRLKLRKANPLELQRHINLVNPEDRAMVANVYGEDLARRLGVMTHISKFVRVFINERYYGVYHQTTREDDGMMLANRRVPGPLFEGSYLGDLKIHDNWQNEPRFWRKEHFEVTGKEDFLDKVDPLGRMLSAIAMKPGIERYALLWDTVSLDKYARWDAFMKVAGGNHTDQTHNHLFYFDPRMGLMEPVTVDINGHGMMYYPRWLDRYFKPFEPDHQLPLNERLQPLLDAALRDPRFLHRRNAALHDALDGAGSAAAQYAILDSIYARIDKDVRADRNKGSLEGLSTGLYRQPFSNAEYDRAKRLMRRWIKDRNDFLKAELNTLSVNVRLAQVGNGTVFEVAVTGNSSASLDVGALNTTVLADKGLNGTFSHVGADRLLLPPGLTQDTDFNYPYYGVRPGRYWLRAGTQRYLFTVPALSPDELSPRLMRAFSSALSKKTLAPALKRDPGIDPASVAYDPNSVHLWRFPEESEGDVVVGPGEITLTATLTVGPKQRLVVAPGTVLKMAPGVSIVSRGRAMIRGRADAPIRIERLKPEKPWGGLLFLGDGTAGSVIAHARIVGGSFARTGIVVSSGMVSVYGSRGFRLDNAVLGGNTDSDDTLHVVYGDAAITNSRIEDCFGDCIDFDFVKGTIEGLATRRSGNDGIDFMMSDFTLKDIDVAVAGDKGLSVGELSQVRASGIRISGAVIGIAVKDSSKISLAQAVLSGNDFGVDLYKKHWRYGGPGHAAISQTTFDGNGVDVRAAKGAVLDLGPGARPSKIVRRDSRRIAVR